MTSPGRDYDDLTSPDDFAGTVTLEQYRRNEKAREDAVEHRVVESWRDTGGASSHELAC